MLISLASVEAKSFQERKFPSKLQFQKRTSHLQAEKPSLKEKSAPKKASTPACSSCFCKCPEDKDLYGCFSYIFEGPYGEANCNLPYYLVEIGVITSAGKGTLTGKGCATIDGQGPIKETLWECTYSFDSERCGAFSTCCTLSWDGQEVATNIIWKCNTSECGNFLRCIIVPDENRNDDFAEVQIVGNGSRQ